MNRFRRLVAASHYNADDIKITETKDDSKDSKDESDNSISSELNEPSKSTDILEGDGDKNNMKDCEEDYLEFMAKLGQLKRESHFPLLHKSNVKHGRLFVRITSLTSKFLVLIILFLVPQKEG